MTDVVINNAQAVADSLVWGPKMRALSPMQRAFVIALLNDQTDNATRAAIEAGYSKEQASAKSIASRLRHQPAILEVIHECAVAHLSSLKLLATQTVRDILASPASRPADKLKAAALVYDRSENAMPIKSKQTIRVEHTVAKGLKEQIEEILALCATANRDARAVMGDAYYHKAIEFGLVIDADFVPVEEPMPPGPGSGGKQANHDFRQPMLVSESTPPKRASAMSFVGLEDVL